MEQVIGWKKTPCYQEAGNLFPQSALEDGRFQCRTKKRRSGQVMLESVEGLVKEDSEWPCGSISRSLPTKHSVKQPVSLRFSSNPPSKTARDLKPCNHLSHSVFLMPTRCLSQPSCLSLRLE